MDNNTVYIEEITQQINHLKMQRRSSESKHKTGRGSGFILSYLYYNGNEVIPSELGKAMNVSTPRITAILNKLETKQLIVRTISPEDRRNVFISLSKQGKQLVEEQLLQQQKFIQTLVERLDKEDVEAFIRVLNTLEIIIDEQGWGL